MSSTAGENITTLLQKNQCCCLNEDLKAPHTNLFVGDHTLPLRSDADEQLLLHLGFNQTMKLSSIILGIPDSSSCPKTLKLFCNQNNLGFEDATGDYSSQLANSTSLLSSTQKNEAVAVRRLLITPIDDATLLL